jgi:hypothetical protein
MQLRVNSIEQHSHTAAVRPKGDLAYSIKERQSTPNKGYCGYFRPSVGSCTGSFASSNALLCRRSSKLLSMRVCLVLASWLLSTSFLGRWEKTSVLYCIVSHTCTHEHV